ncbi:energy-coupling factor transporter transmembrane component T family protein [Roseospira visakhapatnamensis]|uniref:Biotin transport system permease protein n=1 Tax=Roseospira visakhapatnamensis TaxID=390880 RepID=A0A7W6RB34_9PROT|nr:energy-coupling factor transporter transmembrane protein EcfT [Roseospira visakhapatnamensis]MBB4265271.1 biotin transport system permease protein [Roseospira visakhapatnamensis]
MRLGLYLAGDSLFHRMSPGPKLATVAVAGTVLFFLDDWRALAASLGVVLLLYAIARVPWPVAVAQIRPTLWVLGLLFVMLALIEGPLAGVVMVLRFAALILLAALVTLTTRVSDMTDAIEAGLRPFARLGLNPAVVSLAISMAIRFIPLIAEITREVRDAQRARGLGRSVLAVAVPVIVRTIKLADDVADAMDARSYDPTPRSRRDHAAVAAADRDTGNRAR